MSQDARFNRSRKRSASHRMIAKMPVEVRREMSILFQETVKKHELEEEEVGEGSEDTGDTIYGCYVTDSASVNKDTDTSIDVMDEVWDRGGFVDDGVGNITIPEDLDGIYEIWFEVWGETSKRPL